MSRRTFLFLVVLLFLLFSVAALMRSNAARPDGTIIISSVTDPKFPFLDAYALDVKTGTFAQAEPDAVSQENMYAFSADYVAVAFLGATEQEVNGVVNQHKPADPMQVYVALRNVSPGSLPSVSQARKLTNDTTVKKSFPVISDDERSVLYMQAPLGDTASSSRGVDSYTIRMFSDNKQTPLSVSGMYPQWLGSNQFYYLASDGVRLYDVAYASSTLVLPVATQPNFKLSVSHKRDMLAFSNPDSQTIFLYSILAHGLQLEPIKTINMKGFWMAYSPDDSFLGVQTVDENSAPRIIIFDTKDFAQVGQPIQLSPLMNDRLFVTAWIR